MFTIKTEPFGRFTQIKLINNLSGEYVGVIPDFGAALNALVLKKNDRLYDLIDGSNTYEELMEQGIKLCKGMVLFPFPNRLKDGKYTFEGNAYELPINELDKNNSIHGLVTTSKFSVRKFETDEQKASLTLVHDEKGTNTGYPFKAKLEITFTITSDSELICECEVTNSDIKNIPFGLGWHPYFKALDKINDLQLTIPSDKMLEVDNRMNPTGKLVPNLLFTSPTLIDNHQLDTGFKIESKSETATTAIFDSQNKVTLNIWQETGVGKYNFLQYYIPDYRGSIAVEPMTCAPDAFNNGMGLISLKPAEKSAVKFGVKLS